MTDDITTGPTPARIEIARGQQAQQALENPLIAEALAAWEQEITQAWSDSPLRDAEGRERLRLMLEAARHFRRHLTTTLETGQLARVQVQRDSLIKRAADRAREVLR